MVGKRNETGFLNAAICYVKGIAASSALRHAGFPESTCLHSSKRALETRGMKKAFRRIGKALAEELSGPDYAETLAFLQDEKSGPKEVRETARRLYEQYEQKTDRRENPSQAIECLPEISKLLLWNDPPEREKWEKRKSPSVQKAAKENGPDGEVALSLVKLLNQPIEQVEWNEIGARAKELIRQELFNPPKDGRTRMQLYRLALEGAKELGANAELHLHQHQHGYLSPQVARMLAEEMIEIQAERDQAARNAEATDAEIVTGQGGIHENATA